MKTNRIVLITFIAVGLIGGCKKTGSDDPVTPGPNTPAADGIFSTLFAQNIANATEQFNLNASSGGVLLSARGTELDFEPGAFTYVDGSPVVGSVQVSLVEVLTVSDMILLNKQTVGNDNGTMRVLRSGGAINVYATQGGTPVRIGEGGLVASIATNVGDPSMELFTGNEDADGNMIWDPIDSGIVTVDSAYYDSTDYTYTFPYYFYYDIGGPTDLNWINCDYWWNAPNTTTINATLPAGQSSDSTLVWLVMPSINSVISMYYAGSQTYNSLNIPVGTEAAVVGLRQTASGYSSSFTPVTISAGMSVPMTFSPTTLEQFEADVNAL